MSISLQLENLSVGYREVIVHDLSFSASSGESLAVIGVNGAGKSTILKAIIGEARVHAGRVYFNGTDITGYAGNVLASMGVGYVPQVRDAFPGLTVLENLRMGGYLLPRREVASAIAEVLDRFPQLGPKRYTLAHQLSGGERKQLGIGRALMSKPSILLLDEPTSNLAPNLAEEVLRDISRITSDGRCVIVVEQRVEAVLRVADRACLISNGTPQMLSDARSVLEFIQTHGLFGQDKPSQVRSGSLL